LLVGKAAPPTKSETAFPVGSRSGQCFAGPPLGSPLYQDWGVIVNRHTAKEKGELR